MEIGQKVDGVKMRVKAEHLRPGDEFFRRGERMTYGRRQPGPEEAECRIFAAWMEMFAPGLLYTHVAHGGNLSKAMSGTLKAMGKKKGVPDYLVFDPFELDGRRYSGLAGEMKRPGGGVVSPDQSSWLQSLAVCEWYCCVWHSADEAIGVVTKFYPDNVKKARIK